MRQSQKIVAVVIIIYRPLWITAIRCIVVSYLVDKSSVFVHNFVDNRCITDLFARLVSAFSLAGLGHAGRVRDLRGLG